MERTLNTREAAERLGISMAAICRLIGRGTLAARFVNGGWLIRIETIEMLEANPAYRARSRARARLRESRRNELQRLLELEE